MTPLGLPPASDEIRPPARVVVNGLQRFICDLFAAAGLTGEAAEIMAQAMIEADLEGLPSHGVMQAEAYLERLKRGSVSTRDKAEIVHDRDAIAVMDAGHMLGHLAGDQAMALAIEKAGRFGLGAVAVRHAFHFGTAGRYARRAADAGCVGIAMSNSRPVMPAPGGAQPLVGTNPLAISVPTPAEPHIVLDMATTAGTVGRIRMAAKAGRSLPDGWAVNADGEATNDPREALEGMLLPMGGAKGFGLALIIDLLAGGLSSGSWGDDVRGLHAEPGTPYDNSHFFIAIDVEHFRALSEFTGQSALAVERVHNSRRAAGIERLYVPGERKSLTRVGSDGILTLEAVQVDALLRLAGELGVDPRGLTGAIRDS